MTFALIACATIQNSPVSKSKSSIAPDSKPVDYKALQRVNVTRAYEDNCAKCHGSRGEGGGGGTKSLLTMEKYDQKYDKPFFDAIKNGVKDMGMEAYGETMSDPEIWAQVVHIRELQKNGLRAAGMRPNRTDDGVVRTKYENYRIETVVDKGLDVPWAVDWLPDGKMLITNRSGALNVFSDGMLSDAVEGVPETIQFGQGGLMDVAVHPDYAQNGWIYLSFTDPAKSGMGGMTKVVRGKLKFEGNRAKWIENQTIFECEPSTYNSSGVHFGNRIVFDGKGHIFFCIGERGSGELAQDLSKPNGKIYRVFEDGTVPKDNPFYGKTVQGKRAIDAVWSYGHRNPQGLVFGLDGRLWDTEHGPRGGDEVNLIEKGANYGWPEVAFSINYNDSPYRVPWPNKDQHFVMPIFRWLPSIGACGLDVSPGGVFPKWKGDLFAGGLSGANVDRIRTKDGKFVECEEILWNLGRVRDVVCDKKGNIYVVLNQPDKVIRLVPAQ